jgi:WS/DGAT/MGAT family acyltransferase
MQRLRACDARYLSLETATQHMHTIKVAVLDPAPKPARHSYERLRDYLTAQAGGLAPFRRRLVPMPLALFHPLWADQAAIEPARHIHRTTAAPPGGRRELCEVISRVASKPLDRAHPLWGVWVVEELERGRVALVFKIHHAIADGLASVRLLTELLEGPGSGAGRTPGRPETVPSALARGLSCAGPLLRLATGLPALLARTAGATGAGRRRRPRDQPPTRPVLFSAPFTRFNHRLTPNRCYACATVALDDVKAITHACGCTVNDVVLAVTGGAVRDYLQSHGELPRQSLTACVPVSVRARAEVQDWGNRLSELFTPVHTDVADPVQRLRAVHRAMRTARRHHDRTDRRLWEMWWDYGALFHGCLRALTWLAGVITRRPPCTLTVSSVRGPARPLSCGGARVVAIHSMGPIVNNVGLNITAWSYFDQLSFGVVCCPESLPDVWELADRIPGQVARLRKGAG